MFLNNNTNKVYIPFVEDGYSSMFESLRQAFSQAGIDYSAISGITSKKHVWARDYMPIQQSADRFIQYVYSPDYLKDYPDYIPNVDDIMTSLDITPERTDIVLDGGNLINCSGRIIMTDKIFHENPSYSPNALTKKIEQLFESELILIPWDRYEPFGHADGMVRYINGNDVLLNNYIDFDPSLRTRLRAALQPHFHIEELHYVTKKRSPLNWAYINFLHVSNHLFVPSLSLEEDHQALSQLQDFYSPCHIHPIPHCRNLIKDGGALNCISWNIRK